MRPNHGAPICYCDACVKHRENPMSTFRKQYRELSDAEREHIEQIKDAAQVRREGVHVKTFGRLQLVLNGVLLGLSIHMYPLQHHTNDLLVMGWSVAWILIGWRLTK